MLVDNVHNPYASNDVQRIYIVKPSQSRQSAELVLQSLELGPPPLPPPPPTPSPAGECSHPPWFREEGHTHLRERGWGRGGPNSIIPTRGHTLWEREREQLRGGQDVCRSWWQWASCSWRWPGQNRGRHHTASGTDLPANLNGVKKNWKSSCNCHKIIS